MNANTVLDVNVLSSLPPEWGAELLPAIKETIECSDRKIVILDDDPTGTQTVRDINVLTDWSLAALKHALQNDDPAFFILTNSRSLSETEACELARKIGGNLHRASRQCGVEITLISRSDSTLRGHFPSEVDAVAGAMGLRGSPYLVVPFFLEGGRYTIDDIHYVREGNQLLPAARTVFAQDAAFGFRNSNLKQWVAEKTNGAITAEDVQSISLKDIRQGGPDHVADILDSLVSDTACIVNAASYSDMHVLVAGLLKAESRGRSFLLRTGASFVQARIGQAGSKDLLSREQLVSTSDAGGLFIIGSYVEKTSRQMAVLFDEPDLARVEVSVDHLLTASRQQAEIERVATFASTNIKNGRDTAIYTSRRLVHGKDAAASLEIGRTVSKSLIEIVRSISVQPKYLVAKGGITSSDIATDGLGVKKTKVLGQALPGVPVWRLGEETRYSGMPYIVFPGNVGSKDALATLRRSLR